MLIFNGEDDNFNEGVAIAASNLFDATHNASEKAYILDVIEKKIDKNKKKLTIYYAMNELKKCPENIARAEKTATMLKVKYVGAEQNAQKASQAVIDTQTALDVARETARNEVAAQIAAKQTHIAAQIAAQAAAQDAAQAAAIQAAILAAIQAATVDQATVDQATVVQATQVAAPPPLYDDDDIFSNNRGTGEGEGEDVVNYI